MLTTSTYIRNTWHTEDPTDAQVVGLLEERFLRSACMIDMSLDRKTLVKQLLCLTGVRTPNGPICPHKP